MSFLKRLWARLFGEKRKPRFLDYDTTVDPDTGLLSHEANARRKQILQTELKEGDTYRLGPEAIVTVGPEGLAGKRWIKRRVAQNEKKRKAHFERWWAEKRTRAIEIMLMSEEELKASGIYDAVQAWIAENREFLAMAGAKGLLPTKQDPGPDVEKAPSSRHDDRVREQFSEIAKNLDTEVAIVLPPFSGDWNSASEEDKSAYLASAAEFNSKTRKGG